MGMPNKLHGKSDKKGRFSIVCPHCKEEFSDFYIKEEKHGSEKKYRKLCPHCEYEFMPSELTKR